MANTRNSASNSISSRLAASGLALSMALGTMFAPTAAVAGPRHQVTVAAHSQQGAQTIDDARDLVKLHRTIAQWQVATASHDRYLERQADRGIAMWIEAEIAENRVEVQQARNEAIRSQNELRHSRKVAVRHGANTYTMAEVGQNRVEARDDNQDLMEKRRDTNRTRAIAMELQQMQPAFVGGRATARMYQRKATLLGELKVIARAELGEDREELREKRTPPPPQPYY